MPEHSQPDWLVNGKKFSINNPVAERVFLESEKSSDGWVAVPNGSLTMIA